MNDNERQTTETLSVLEFFESSAPVGFAFIDTDLRFARANEAFEKMTRLSRDELLGHTPVEIAPVIWSAYAESWQLLIEEHQPVVNQEVIGEFQGTSTGSYSWLMSAYPIEHDGSVKGFGVVIVDVSELTNARERQQALTHAAVEALATTVETRDRYTAGHQRRVAKLSEAIAREMKIDEFDCEGIAIAGHIHDIGKIAIPAEILARPGQLADLEMDLVKTHCQVGHDIVAGIDFSWPIATMVLQHHERIDGSGYPAGLRRDEILLGSRIIAVADVVDAMASHRPYRPAHGIDSALEEVANGSGRLYDPTVVEVCVKLFRDEGFEFD